MLEAMINFEVIPRTQIAKRVAHGTSLVFSAVLVLHNSKTTEDTKPLGGTFTLFYYTTLLAK